jgi:hypothetical protein
MVDRTVDFCLERLDAWANRRHSRAPLCEAPLASEAEYVRRWQLVRAEDYPEIDDYERACGAAIDPEWFHRLGLLTQVTVKRSATCYAHGRLLYATLVRYARERCRDDVNVVETGTARGFSALCLARALADAGASGKIVTFDVLPHDTPMYWNSVVDATGPRTRSELLADYTCLIDRYVLFHRGDTRLELRKLAFPRVHFAFLDSVHTYDHVVTEFTSIRGRQRAGDILFFDDYNAEAYPGVVKAADEICRTHAYTATIVSASRQRRYLIAEKQ